MKPNQNTSSRNPTVITSRFMLIFVAFVLLLAGTALADDVSLPSFIQVSKKYTFAIAVDAKTATWIKVTGTVTELDTAGWLTIRDDSGLRHLNMRQVLYVTDTE